ncbi:MAG: potassium/proton antiporter [Microscillaceae bacterium]
MVTMHLVLLVSSLLVFLGIILSKFTSRIGAPTLLAFLTIGLLFGNGGKYDFTYDYPALTLNIGQLALCLILFSGGLNTDFKHIRPVIFTGLTLSTLGVLLSTFIIGFLTHQLLGLNWLSSLLLGAIVSSTDAAAVFSIIEAKKLRLRENISPTLEFESGTNDPMAYFLTTALVAYIGSGSSDWVSLAPWFLYSMVVGGLVGSVMGYAAVRIMKLIKLNTGQNPVLLLAVVFFTFASCELMGANSLLAVYVAGIVFGNLRMNISYLGNYFQGLSWLMEILLFTTLGLQIFIQDLPGVFGWGLIVSVLVMFVARPLSVAVCLLFSRNSFKKYIYIAWGGLKGATPIVFALIPLIAQLPDAKMIFNITFYVVLSSILGQGLSLGWLAEKLKLNEKTTNKSASKPSSSPHPAQNTISETSSLIV